MSSIAQTQQFTTFADFSAYLTEKANRGEFPTDEEMSELFGYAEKETKDQLPRIIEEVAHHISHGDSKEDLVNAVVIRMEREGISPFFAAGFLVYKLAELQNDGKGIDLS